MATAAFGDSAPAQLCFPLGTAALPWASTVTMHVSRPKSAKGQRPSLSHRQAMEACPCHVPSSPLAASPRELLHSQRAALTKPAFPPAQVSREKIPKLLQQVPLRSPSSSLNKYRVLPSIVGRAAGSEGQQQAPKAKAVSGGQGSASTLSGSDIATEESSQVHCAPGQGGRQEGLEEPLVLLAVRSPSGQRFEHHFKPSDSLQTVLAVAGQKLLANYQHCRVETMEVPRRSFCDLSKSLQECGILARSVLCIRRDEHDADL
ncbi:UBX domain-containing protein 10 [Oenanthe melanoleuca]|uniref:UBX domain-containing protein 10 n=1 Tax=Oenanthe melanoleuca TaxID=2939378 RepID=UPI0024C1DA2F|nr:UBX domain-containing protein 10 [Oenanthe melanoleuca]XP_056364029.1 UBX domain-containing protein 10 [Oenanthe melanoleuca]